VTGPQADALWMAAMAFGLTIIIGIIMLASLGWLL
jgi:hypothetical protein